MLVAITYYRLIHQTLSYSLLYSLVFFFKCNFLNFAVANGLLFLQIVASVVSSVKST